MNASNTVMSSWHWWCDETCWKMDDSSSLTATSPSTFDWLQSSSWNYNERLQTMTWQSESCLLWL